MEVYVMDEIKENNEKTITFSQEIKDKEKNNTKDIRQSKKLPHFRYKLGITEQKMMMCLIGHLKREDKIFTDSELSVTEIAKYCGFDTVNPYRLLTATAKNLTQSVIEYYYNGKWKFIPWFSYIGCENGIVQYKFNDTLTPELLQLDGTPGKFYIPIDPVILPYFKSSHGLRLYIIFKGELIFHRNELLYSLEELCDKFMLSTAYNPKKTANAAANQRVKIIAPAIEEINNIPLSKINASYKPIKEGRRITGWRLDFAFRNPSEKIENEYDIVISQSNQKEQDIQPVPASQVPQSQNEWENDDHVKSELKRLLSIGVDALELNQILKLFTNAEQFLQATAYADKIYEKSLKNPTGVGNPGGLYASTLKKYAANPDTISLFEDVQNEQTAQNEFKATAIKLALDNATTWEEIVDIAMQQSSPSEAEKMLHEAESKRPELLKRYQKAYELKYRDSGDKYDLMLEIARMNICDDRGNPAGVSALKIPAVDYSLIEE